MKRPNNLSKALSSKGGAVTAEESPAKAAALAALHASRRGVRVNPCPVKVRRALTLVRTLLDEWNSFSRVRLGTSIKSWAREQGVDNRSVRRWLAGEVNPDTRWHPAILEWAATAKAAAERLRKGVEK